MLSHGAFTALPRATVTQVNTYELLLSNWIHIEVAGKFNWEHMALCSRLFYLCFPWRTPQRNPCARLMVTRCVTYLPGFKGRTMRTLLLNLHTSAFHCSELDESEIDLSQKRSECEHSNVNWDRSKWRESEIDLNECEHVCKENLNVNWDRDILLSEFWVFLDGGR